MAPLNRRSSRDCLTDSVSFDENGEYKPKALTLVKPGVLEFKNIDLNGIELQESEILVQVEYTGVQPLDADVYACKGTFKDLPLPHIMGVEGVGRVMESRHQAFSEGDRVAFLLRKFFGDSSHGCWQSRVVLNPERVLIVPVPVDVASNQIAACTTSTVAALALLRHFPPGSQVLVTGACGAVGLTIIQLGLLRGLQMVGLLRGSERAAWLQKAFADIGKVAVIDTSLPDWQKIAFPVVGRGEAPPDEIDINSGSGFSGGGADGIIDGVGADVLAVAAEQLLRARARVIRFSSIGGPADEERLAAAVKKLRLEVRHETIENFMTTSDLVAQVEGVFKLIAQGRLRPTAFHVVTWQEAFQCLKEQPVWTRHETLLKPNKIGRIILRFD